ncbi:E3 ubiquitin-protein ligase RNF115-like isoform X1 [Dinothrombium tinctorium]|uniref:RING-type E3 ubiquitin transferase n=1 Tax=Dinothrombium tinctorium TaxID=1965070 RepID=A0A443RRY0_9ACAR|nr:E3 ubiquitin-protein ligase RNF115-like isoform X1 [Dinothrombium tinctorium]
MAEPLVEVPPRYFCHKCSQEITPLLPDFVCPRCRMGFIEEVTNEQSNESHSTDDSLFMSDDSDAEPSSMESSHIADLLENLGGQFPFTNSEDRSWNDYRRSSEVNSEAMVHTSTPNDASDEAETSSSARGRSQRNLRGAARIRARNSRSPRYVQFSFPPEANFDSQQALEGIFNHIISGTSLGQLAAQQGANSSRDRSGNGGRRGEFINFDYQFPLFQVLHGNPGDYAWGSGGLDAVISQLLNQLDGTGPPPMPKDEIDRLPIVKITQDQVDKNLQCTVCMEDYKLAEDVKKLPCTHVYHHECIVPWLEMHGTCPICRKLLNTNASQTSQPNDRVFNSQRTNHGTNSSNSSTSNNTSSSSAYYEPDCD